MAGVIAVAMIVWVALIYSVSWHVTGGTSDNASSLLSGRDLVHGNVFLHGWHLPADSFWLLDLPLLGLMSTIMDMGPASFHVEPTAVASFTVLVAMLYAARGTNRGNAAIAAAVTFLIIGLPSSVFAAFFLQTPTHVMTTLGCLLAFGLLGPGRSRQRLMGGTLLLVIVVSSDPLALLIGVVPVVAAGIAASRTRNLREGVPLVVAGAIAAVSGEGLARIVTALGGFRRLPTLRLAASSQWLPNLRLAARDLFFTFGVRVPSSWPHVAGPARFVHVAGLAFTGLAVTLALVDLARRLLFGRGRGSWIDDVCVVGFVGSVTFFVLVVFPGENVSRIRYLLPAMVFGAILAGRFATALLGGTLGRANERWTTRRVPHAVRAAAVATAAVIIVGGYASETIASVRTTNPPNPSIALAAWLSAHHLTEGWGGYWDANVTTVISGDDVRVLPVIAVRGRLHGFGNLASDKWFSAPRSDRPPATFLVYQPRAPWGDVNLATATNTFGPPDERVHVGVFAVLIWDHDTRAELRPVVVG